MNLMIIIQYIAEWLHFVSDQIVHVLQMLFNIIILRNPELLILLGRRESKDQWMTHFMFF